MARAPSLAACSRKGKGQFPEDGLRKCMMTIEKNSFSLYHFSTFCQDRKGGSLAKKIRVLICVLTGFGPLVIIESIRQERQGRFSSEEGSSYHYKWMLRPQRLRGLLAARESSSPLCLSSSGLSGFFFRLRRLSSFRPERTLPEHPGVERSDSGGIFERNFHPCPRCHWVGGRSFIPRRGADTKFVSRLHGGPFISPQRKRFFC